MPKKINRNRKVCTNAPITIVLEELTELSFEDLEDALILKLQDLDMDEVWSSTITKIIKASKG